MASKDANEFLLDILAQQPRINRLYTQLIFCFPIPQNVATIESQIIERLNAALERVHSSFPWTSGNVIQKEEHFAIKLEAQRSALIVQDLKSNSSVPDWTTLCEAAFPFRWLDETLVAGRQTLAEEAELKTGLPVFVVKANFIHGGLLLSFDSQHGSMDMAGQAQMIRLFAKACRDEGFDLEELTTGNMDRTNIIPLLEESQMLQPTTKSPEAEKPKRNDPSSSKTKPSPLTWAYFSFSSEVLSSLKSKANVHVPQDSFMSTDDVLSAYIWQCMTRARAARMGGDASLKSTLSRNVDTRRCFSLPPTYPGLMVTSTLNTLCIADLLRTELGTVATQLREKLDAAELKHQMQSQATAISQKNVDSHSISANSNPQLDVRLSSWAKETCYDVDFGENLGKPAAVRTPSFVAGAREGLVYFLPKSLDGEIVVGICLREDDMDVLKKDSSMVGWYIG